MNEGKKEQASGGYGKQLKEWMWYTLLCEPTSSRNPKAIHEKENIPENQMTINKI